MPPRQARGQSLHRIFAPLRHARAGELAYTLSRIAPPSVRVVLYYPKNGLIVSGHPAAVEALIGVVD